MLQLEARQKIEAEHLKRAFCTVMVAEVSIISFTPTCDQIEQAAPAIPHLGEALINISEQLPGITLVESHIKIAWFYQGQAVYAQAQFWLKQCCTVAETHLGACHPYAAISRMNLGTLY